jgi:tetratricopeptide (TPR) repeat protein
MSEPLNAFDREARVVPITVVLTLVDGPARGHVIRIPVGERRRIGRGDGNDETFGGDTTLSRRHALLEHLSPGVLTVTDVGSTNGVYVNGARVAGKAALQHGQRVRIGQATLQVEISGGSGDVTQLYDEVNQASPSSAAGSSLPDLLDAARRAYRAGNFDSAEKLFSQVIAGDPGQVAGRLGRGVALFELRRWDEAASEFGEVARREEHNDEAWYRLGRVSEERGDVPRAIAYYKHALTLKQRPDIAARLQQLTGPVVTPEPAPARQPEPAAPRAAAPPPSPVAGGTLIDSPGATLAEAVDAPAGKANQAWDRGEEILRAHRALRSFGREWVGVAVVAGLAAAVDPVLSVLRASAAADRSMRTLLANLDQLRSLALAACLVIGGLLVVRITLGSACTTYHIYERRIDFARGILFRRKSTLWLYDVTDIDYERSPLMLLTNTASLTLMTEAAKVPRGAPSVFRRAGAGAQSASVEKIIGVGTAAAMERLWHQLRTSVLRERRSMKKQFL